MIARRVRRVSTHRSTPRSEPGTQSYTDRSVTPDSSSTSSHSSALPVYSRAGLLRTAYAASAYTAGLRARPIASSPPSRFCTAAVATRVRGHSVFDAMPSPRSSSANAKAHNDIPYLAIM